MGKATNLNCLKKRHNLIHGGGWIHSWMQYRPKIQNIVEYTVSDYIRSETVSSYVKT